MRKVEQVDIKKKMTADNIVRQMAAAGVMGGGRLSKAADVLEEMIKDKDCRVFMGVAGAMVPGGMKNIIVEMLEQGWVDVLVITGANLTHDLAEALGYSHYQGQHTADDAELKKTGLDRIYDAYMPDKVYEGIGDFCQPILKKMVDKNVGVKELLWELGKNLRPVKGVKSILKTCASRKIPVFCPALSDSGLGLQVWTHNLSKKNKVRVSGFDDLDEIIGLAWTAKRVGVFYVGGGVPKNHVQQALQFSPKSASYAVQITTDRPEPGGSSGAELREGVSWGKLSSRARCANVCCDATIALPLIVASLRERL